MDRRTASALLAASAILPAWGQARRRTVAILLDSLTSAFWQASLTALRAEAARRGCEVLEAVSNTDDSRQYQQVLSMIQRRVDGIIIVHTDAKAVVPAIRAANAAAIPMVHFNRMPAPSDAYSVAVVADNRSIMRDTVQALAAKALKQGGHYHAAVLIGDLADPNAVQRRDGFEDAIGKVVKQIEVVARISTDWDADKAFAGLTNALRAHDDIDFLVSSSDFLIPQIEQALRTAGKWHRAGEAGHVLVASFDGDANAYAMLSAGYFDVDGVQNLDYEVQLTFDALQEIWTGHKPARLLRDPGLIIDRQHLVQQRDQMWGYRIFRSGESARARALATRQSTQPTNGTGVRLEPRRLLPLLWIGFTLFADAFLSIGNARDILLGMLPLAILVAGQMLVLIAGQIDLSMTTVMPLCSLAAGTVSSHVATGRALQVACSVLAALVLGVLIGTFNGLCTVFLRMPAFIVTLAVLIVGGGTATWYAAAASESIRTASLPAPFIAIGYGTALGIPIALVVCGALLLAVQWLLSRSILGRWLYAVGQNARAARIAGVPVSAVTIAAFAASGFCAALAAIIYTARLESAQPTLGNTMLLDIIGAAVIGGVSLFGGRGTLWMALAGVLFLSVLDKSLQLLGLSLFLVLVVKGLAILAAATLDARRQRRGQR